jgi:hypothetical protein
VGDLAEDALGGGAGVGQRDAIAGAERNAALEAVVRVLDEVALAARRHGADGEALHLTVEHELVAATGRAGKIVDTTLSELHGNGLLANSGPITDPAGAVLGSQQFGVIRILATSTSMARGFSRIGSEQFGIVRSAQLRAYKPMGEPCRD